MNFQNYKRRATEELDRNLWSRPYDPFRDVKRTIRDAGELDDSFNSTGIEYLNRFIPRVIKTEKGTTKGWIYFIQNTVTGNIKIGKSLDPEDRLRNIQTGNDCLLEIVHKVFVKDMETEEVYYHNKFAHLRLLGEWFKCGPELKEFLERE